MKALSRPVCNHSFSLVETVVAMGLVSFAVLTTIGLLSIGGDTAKRAKDESSAARLVENELERLRSLSATSFSNYYPTYTSKYYDSNLSELPNSTNAIYQLKITFANGPTGTADLVANAELRYPANTPATNQSVYRFTALMNIPSP
jgi:uncharacterized protein (TIGR02598 family)